MWRYNYTNELYHHGVKGMKWGVRRYQNPDGTLTTEGRKRYQIHRDDSTFTRWAKKTRKKIETARAQKLYKRDEEREVEAAKKRELKEYEKLAKKDPKKMTDEELAKHIIRLQTEKQTLSLRSDVQKLEPHKEEGKKFFEKTASNKEKEPKFRKQFAENAVKPALTTAGKDLLTKYLTKQGGKLLGLSDKEMDGSMKMLKDLAEKAGFENTITKAKQAKVTLEKQMAETEKTKAIAAAEIAKQRAAEADAKRAESEAKAAAEAAKRWSKETYSAPVSSISSSVSVGEDYLKQFTWDDYYDDWI